MRNHEPDHLQGEGEWPPGAGLTFWGAVSALAWAVAIIAAMAWIF